MQIKTRAERGLEPYVSPKKDWDVIPTGDVEQGKPTRQQLRAAAREKPAVQAQTKPATRSERRAKQRDWASMLRKNQERATRNQIKRAHTEQNALAIARVRLLGSDNLAMTRNVTVAVEAHSRTLMKREHLPTFVEALKQTDKGLQELLVSAGEL